MTSDIKFNCPQCDQHLSVDAAAAGATVACPKCGQSIIVPQMAKIVARAEKPKAMKWAPVVAGAGGVALLAAGGLIWQMQRRPTPQTASGRISVGPKNGGTTNPGPATLTPRVAANPPPPMAAASTARVIAAAVEPARSAQGFDARAETTHKTEAAEHLDNFNNPEDQAWLAWAKKLPISATPLPQPRLRNQNLSLKNFSDHPLFGPDGPSRDDVLQGGLGDCYFLSLVAALADAHPDFIRKVINEVGDGTYVVHLVRLEDHRPFAIRINADLWVVHHLGRLQDALQDALVGRVQWHYEPGQAELRQLQDLTSWVRPVTATVMAHAFSRDQAQERHFQDARVGGDPQSAIWPALLEKAYALTRKPPYNYEAAIGGCEDCGTLCFLPVKSLTFGLGASKPYTDPYWDSHEHWIVSEPVPAQEVANWFNRGEPKGPVADAVGAYSLRMLEWFKKQHDAGKAVVVGSVELLSSKVPLIPPKPGEVKKHAPRTDTYRRTEHGYILADTKTDRDGKPVGVVLRNQVLGTYVTLTDLGRIYFCIGMAFVVEPDSNPIPFLPPSLENVTSR